MDEPGNARLEALRIPRELKAAFVAACTRRHVSQPEAHREALRLWILCMDELLRGGVRPEDIQAWLAERGRECQGPGEDGAE